MPGAENKEAGNLTVTLLGHAYQVACPPEDRDIIRKAAAYLDRQLRLAREKSRLGGNERVALMVAVNLAAEVIRLQKSLADREADFEKLGERLRALVDRAGVAG